MYVLVLNGVISILLFTRVYMAISSRERGTNAVTRFVRDSCSNYKLNRYLMYSAFLTAVTLFFSYMTNFYWACLPSAGVFLFIVISKITSTKSKQRVEDTRMITKASLRPAAATAPIAGGIAGFAVGGPAGAVAGAGAGSLVTAGLVTADRNMHVDMDELDPSDFKETLDVQDSLLTISSEAAFIAAAQRAGITTDGKNLHEIAGMVLDNAPTAMLEELPETMSIEDKAMTILGREEEAP